MGRRRSRGGRSRPPTRRPGVTVALQNLHVQGRFPNFAFELRGGHAGRWVGKLQPREASQTYTIAIDYRLGDVPHVRVLSPTLHPKAPHVYPDGTLCLYWPEKWPWRRAELLAETIIPWAAVWLHYYELWLDTDKWLGPASPHGLVKSPNGDGPRDD
jgi:hypothetical protein